MLRTLLDLWRLLLDGIYWMLRGGRAMPLGGMDGLRVYVKTVGGQVIPVDLGMDWDIGRVKEVVAGKVGQGKGDIKIILAGKELQDSVVIQQCDLGQHSVLHAVLVVGRPEVPADDMASAEPLCESLLDLQLTEEERRFIEQGDTERRKAQFYVYCNTCRRMQTGKLRVCCDQCRSGAFTVSRDPACWEDVLTPGRVAGRCETPDCSGSANFYFKCTVHISEGEQDRSVALDLVRSNVHDVPCLSCADVSDLVMVFQCESAHAMCLECFQTYCTVRLNERGFVQDRQCGYTLPCAAGCTDSLIKETHHFRLIGDHLYERYQRFGAEECVLQEGGVLCPQPGCGMGLLPDPECRRIVCESGCGFVFCRNCLQGYHLGDCIAAEDANGNASGTSRNYSINPDRAAQASWEEATRVAIRITTKPCPKCRTPTERDGGCMHMVCTRSQCGFHWCWICQTEWSRECMGNHWFG